MPEGHVTHRTAHRLDALFAGQLTRSSSPQGRFAVEASEIDGHVLERADAVGKHLFVWFGARAVHVHLGRAGRLRFADDDARPVVGQVRWRLETDQWYADLAGPSVCELVAPDAVTTLVTALGPDPLRDDDPDLAWPRIRASRTPIAVLLMDQGVAAGVGNIFRSELLYRHRLDPMMAGRLLRRGEWLAMWDDLVELMRYAVAHGRIDTVRPEHEPAAMGRPPRTERHGGEVYVYRRAGLPCLVCGARVRTEVVASRNLFWCPRCQRATRRRVPAVGAAPAARPRSRLLPPPAASVSAAAPNVPVMDLILVPGLWLDASSWGDVVPALERAGHRVHALTLPGMGSTDADRSDITLRDHVDAVVAAIDSLDLAAGKPVLVGHSAGGAVAHAAVDARPDRVARVVYVDSGPLGDGDNINDALPVVDGDVPLPDWSVFEPEDLIDLDDDLRAAFRKRAIPSPARVASDPQRLSDERRYDVPITVISCETPSANWQAWAEQGAPFAAELARVRHVDYVDLPTGHWPQLTRPHDLAQAILDAVGAA